MRYKSTIQLLLVLSLVQSAALPAGAADYRNLVMARQAQAQAAYSYNSNVYAQRYVGGFGWAPAVPFCAIAAGASSAVARARLTTSLPCIPHPPLRLERLLWVCP